MYVYIYVIVGGQFDWKDPLSLDRLLTDEERAIRNVARNFAKDRLMPRVVKSFRNERMQRVIIFFIY